MTRQTVRSWLGAIIVLSHFLILVLVLTSPVFLHARMEEAVGFAEVIAPLFAGFTTAIVKYFVGNPTAIAGPQGPRVSVPFVIVSFLPTCALTFLVVFFFVTYVTNYLGVRFEQARTAIAGLEALFGVYVGYVLEDLFRYYPATQTGAQAMPDGNLPRGHAGTSQGGMAPSGGL
jgi:hypothetical protein